MVSNSSFVAFAKEVIWLGPKAMRKAEERAEILVSWFQRPDKAVADATVTSELIKSMTNSGVSAPITPGPMPSSVAGRVSSLIAWAGMDDINNLDGVFSYFASRWAISTFLIAIVLNRARVYGSSRRRLHLNWYARLVLRIIPIVLFSNHLLTILETLRCQTGDLLPTSAASSPGKSWNGAFTHEGGFLHGISSTILFWQSESDSCYAAGMLSLDERPPAGSSSILWPMFLSLCLSHLFETISCALQGRHPVPETAMTIFEHSLAFAEAETIVRGSVGLGFFGVKSQSANDANKEFQKFTRSMILQRLNVPSEVLLIALISTCSHLSNHVLGVLNIQQRCRLINTSIWGLAFMSAFFWSFVRFAKSIHTHEIGLLRYPTVCIVGFIPHIVVFASILVCSTIYTFALFLTMLSPPTSGIVRLSWKERLYMAHDNMVASTALSPVQIRWSDEFYTTLLKIGFIALTAASEAVFFNEGVGVAISRSTWLEELRFKDLSARYPWKNTGLQTVTVPAEITVNSDVADGLNLVDAPADRRRVPVSGYSRERTTAKVTTNASQSATLEDGVGGTQRASRWVMSYMLLQQQFALLGRLVAKVLLGILRKIKPGSITDEMLAFAYPVQVTEKQQASASLATSKRDNDFWIMSDDGSMRRATDTQVDVEMEVRRRLRAGALPVSQKDEDIDDYLYGWWKQGGFWGDIDNSGEYEAESSYDDDNTSVITSTASEIFSDHPSGWESDVSSGQRTPTQTDYTNNTLDTPISSVRRRRAHHTHSHRRSSPQPDDLLSTLSALLDSRTVEEKHQARLLASRLRHSGPLTRAQYSRNRSLNTLRLLGPRERIDDPLTPREEEELLERILLSSRRAANAREGRSSSSTQTWEDGGDGLGAGGPQCVVCQSSPRTILVWPCRCLCLCEDCRVSLAVNNFGSCVTCRRDVVAFSRLFVP